MPATITLIVLTVVMYGVFQPRVLLRRAAYGAHSSCTETTCLLSYIRPHFFRGPDKRFHLRLKRRNLMLAGYGWSEPSDGAP